MSAMTIIPITYLAKEANECSNLLIAPHKGSRQFLLHHIHQIVVGILWVLACSLHISWFHFRFLNARNDVFRILFRVLFPAIFDLAIYKGSLGPPSS
jgi:hypothetical protein